MPSWAPSDEQLQSFYDRAQDRADGETPVDALPATRFEIPDAPGQVCRDKVAGCNDHWLQGWADGKAGRPARLLPPISGPHIGNPCLLAYSNGHYSGRRPG